MSTFAIDGLVSGLDTTGLINQLMQVESVPRERLKSTLAQQGTAISAYQSLNTSLKSVQTAAETLTEDSTWSARTATVTGSSVTATVTSQASLGQTTLTVDSLASAATWTTDAAYALDDDVFTGFPITVTKADGSTVDIHPPAGTMADVMGAINDAADSGVRAIAVKVGEDQYRLQVVAEATGTSAAPQSVTGLGVAVTATAATDAAYTINGLTGTSGSNDIVDLLPGLSVSLTDEGTSTINVADDADALATSIENLVKAANTALESVATSIAAGGEDDARGPLAGDSTVRLLSGQLLQAVADSVGGVSAATYGLETTSEGRLEFNRDTFLAGYAANPEEARTVLAPTSGDGVAQRIADVIDSAVNSSTGTITLAIQGRESTQRDLENQIESWDRRLQLRRTSLERQFSGLELSLSRLQSQSSWLAGQLNTLAANTGG